LTLPTDPAAWGARVARGLAWRGAPCQVVLRVRVQSSQCWCKRHAARTPSLLSTCEDRAPPIAPGQHFLIKEGPREARCKNVPLKMLLWELILATAPLLVLLVSGAEQLSEPPGVPLRHEKSKKNHQQLIRHHKNGHVSEVGQSVSRPDAGPTVKKRRSQNSKPQLVADVATKVSFNGAPNLENKLLAYESVDVESNITASEPKKASGRKTFDVVTRFLRIVETQHLLGDNCTAGTDLNLGEGVVDRCE